jgi:hypothetical protein
VTSGNASIAPELGVCRRCVSAGAARLQDVRRLFAAYQVRARIGQGLESW